MMQKEKDLDLLVSHMMTENDQDDVAMKRVNRILGFGGGNIL